MHPQNARSHSPSPEYSWEGNLPLRGSLRGPLKTSENLKKPPKTSEDPRSQRLSQRQISLSEALGPVAPTHLSLKLSPRIIFFSTSLDDVRIYVLSPWRDDSGPQSISFLLHLQWQWGGAWEDWNTLKQIRCLAARLCQEAWRTATSNKADQRNQPPDPNCNSSCL